MLLPAVFAFFLVRFATADCPPGSFYESFFNKCYQFVPTAKPFLDAEQHCIALGGHLAEESNAFENSYIASIAQGTNSQAPNFWIGANLLRSSNWTWTSNSPMIYTNWAIGQPSNSNSCANVRNTDEKWVTSPCFTALPFMCTISPNVTSSDSCPTATPSPTSEPYGCHSDSVCTDGYTLYPGNCMCYKYFNDTLRSFTDANQVCSEFGGMLAKIPSQDVNDFLTSLPGFECWPVPMACPLFGLVCPNSNLTGCTWADGTALGSFTNFGSHYEIHSPNFFLAATITYSEHVDDGKWISQGAPRAYLCQKDSTRVTKLKNAVPERMTNNPSKFPRTAKIGQNQNASAQKQKQKL